MQSFRTELENPVVEKDIFELEKKIRLFKDGKIDEECFRSLRLARGVYGQRQPGVQMIRIKLPYGKVTGNQLLRIADVADEYSTGNLHITTRQDIQIHYVSLERTPQLWADLEKDDVTLREACGNTVRNVTASETAGIDPKEPFDVSPYAYALFQFFLRNPICQEMGRKFKIAFSSSDDDTALSYLHDLGFIPKIKNGHRGFKVMLGGGLGSQPRHADVLYEFLPTNRIIPVTESVLRIFDRHGERTKRLKARMKYLIANIGLDGFVDLVNKEQKALPHQLFEIEALDENIIINNTIEIPSVNIKDVSAFQTWKETNVFRQKQKGLVAIGIKVQLGNFSTKKARALSRLIETYAQNELRFSLRQNILIRHVQEALLPFFYAELSKIGFAEAGYEATTDITACPGTDTCNLGIASSTGIAKELERILQEEYSQYVNNKALTIKISGCMNACGQHNMSSIGFQGMSIRTPEKLVAPALQVLLGGGILGNGRGRFSDKVIKIPSKRGPEALRILLNDFELNANGHSFLEYYDLKEKYYFYNILKHLSSVDDLTEDDLVDWGHERRYIQAVGIGECAGVIIDLIQTLLFESKEKIDNAQNSLSDKKWSDAIYYAYTSLINTAKALLLSENAKTNTQAGIIKQFDELFVKTNRVQLDSNFSDLVYQLNKNEPTKWFAQNYVQQTIEFLSIAESYRENELTHASA